MKKIHDNQSGFHIIELLLVIAVVGVIGYLGYNYYNNNLGQAANQNPVANDVVAAPTIKTADDLTTAEKVLDETNLDNTDDSSMLDSQLLNF